MGACIGSFVNVVVYRVPAGMSIVRPGSHCPKCGKPIRWHDNLPIFGWLLLGGRCRDCHETISARYPLVELVTALLFLLVGCGVALGNIRGLPGLVSYQAWGLAFYYLLLLCTLWAAALIEYDGHSVSAKIMLPAAIAGILLPLVWPFLLRVPPFWLFDGRGKPLWDVIAGGVAGILLGWLLLVRLARPAQRNGALWGPMLVGIFFGWQVAVSLSLCTAFVGIPRLFVYPRRYRLPRGAIPITGWLTVFSLIWILCPQFVAFSVGL